MELAFLGLGQMGANIARLLSNHGHQLTVWNRTPKQIDGTTSAPSAADAVRGAEAVFTMVFGDEALTDILFKSNAIDAIPRGSTHVSLSTVSVALAERLEREHADRGQHFIGSPVFGRPAVAAEGKLWLIAAGAPEPLARVRPALEQFSRGITVVGDKPSLAHAVKLGGNFLITSMIAGLSEAAVYAQAYGIAPALFLEAVNSALFQSPLYASYSKVMLDPPSPPGATIELGRKDTGLFRKAAAAAGHGAGGVPTPLADLIAHQLERAVSEGHGGEDWAAGYFAQTLRAAGLAAESK